MSNLRSSRFVAVLSAVIQFAPVALAQRTCTVPCIHRVHPYDVVPCTHPCQTPYGVVACHPAGDAIPCIHPLHPFDVIYC